MRHGLRKHPLYTRYYIIRARCYNKASKSYVEYGARGITMCDEWKEDFESFYKWAILNGYAKGLKIDRIDNSKGYSPDNCRWVTQAIQSRNTRMLRKTNSSGFRGVSWHKKQQKFNSRITVNSKTINLGSYLTAIEATKAYDCYVVLNNLEHTINGV